ncbi:unnamed protein product [Closterium sp. NIES-64]|nr:unnamed protein product [Closterium sp. NIES-64]
MSKARGYCRGQYHSTGSNTSTPPQRQLQHKETEEEEEQGRPHTRHPPGRPSGRLDRRREKGGGGGGAHAVGRATGPGRR